MAEDTTTHQVPAPSAPAPAVQAPTVPIAYQVLHNHVQQEPTQTDSMEAGPANARMKIYFDIDKPEEMKMKVDRMISEIERVVGVLREKGLDGTRSKGAP